MTSMPLFSFSPRYRQTSNGLQSCDTWFLRSLGCCYNWVAGIRNKSVANEIVANASTSEASLKANDKVQLTISETGKIVKISNDKQVGLLLSLGHGHSSRSLPRASVSYRNR